MKSLESQLLQHVDTILGPSGLIASAVTEDGRVLAHNRAQHEYARLAAQGFCRRDAVAQRTALSVLQAATGTGKTLGYLVPLMAYAALTGERVAVSTHTRHLQRQVLADTALVQRWLEKACGRTLKVARRIGRKNYVSSAAIERLIDAFDVREDEDGREEKLAFLADLQAWISATSRKGERLNSGILDDFLDEAGLEALPDGISAATLALAATDDEEDHAHYRRDTDLSLEADLLIINHTLAMMNALRWGGMLDDERAMTVMVFDEADRLPLAAEAVLTADVTLHDALSLCKAVGQSLELPAVTAAMTTLYDSIRALKPAPHTALLPLSEQSPQLATVQSQLRMALNTLRPVADQLAGAARGKGSLSGIKTLLPEARNDFLNLANDLSAISHALSRSDENVAVVSWSPVRAYPSLRLGQADPGRLLSRMWAPVQREEEGADAPTPYLTAALFTSATLGVPGRTMPDAFAEFMSSVGIWHLPRRGETSPPHFVQTDLCRVFEPTSFGTMRFVLADPRVENPFQGSEEEGGLLKPSNAWLDYCGTMVAAAHAEGGRTLVLVNSFHDAEALRGRLAAHADDLFVHERGHSLASYLAAFRQQPKGILITPAAWEGIDLPGTLAHVVITRIPYRHPDSLDLVLLQLALRKRGMAADKIKGIILGRISAEARRKLAQGMGRGIRTARDRVTVWMADPRFPMPEEMSASLDPVIIGGQPRRPQTALAQAIPLRFRKRAYPQARILTLEGKLHTPELL